MKLGNMEGSPKEIKDLIENNGLNIADYIEIADRPIKPIFFIIPSIILSISILFPVFFMSLHSYIKTVSLLVGISSSLWLAVNVNIKYKSIWSSITIVIGSTILLLIAIGIIGPLDVLNNLKLFKN